MNRTVLGQNFHSRLCQVGLIALLLLSVCSVNSSDLRAEDFPETAYSTLKYRSIGPYRGGRSAAVTGVPGNPNLFYMGAAGGGVWRTSDSGNTWENISDGFFGGSIGAIAVADSDHNVIYVGGGEVTVRGNVSHGYGMWKSNDAGKTWKHVGLADSRRIPRIRIHPQNPDLVYAASLGHLFGPSQQRGVYRSKDGGKTWKRILFVNDEVGACDLILDPNNPRIIYASTWRIKRTPYSLESGGEGCGLWKSTDGGDSWKNITKNSGLPQGMVGIIGVTVSPVDSNRVWAIIEAADGGVFRSENAGKTWSKINSERKLRQRAWYYSRIYAGTKNKDELWIVNVQFWHSKDGGKTYESIRTPHGDHHDLWIDPEVSTRLIIADDGGAQVSHNAGVNWTTYSNQPTAQFYRVITDNHFPYRIYGAQQDNSTVRIASRTGGGSIGERDWESTAGGESGHIAISPKNDNIVYGGSYGGFLMRINHKTGEVRNINAYPNNPLGHGAIDYKYRFQWNFPVFFSPHDPNTLYTAANVLFKSTNEGQTWEKISPDLTRNDPKKLQSSGGPLTKDNTAVEYYCTIFAALESPHEKGVLWCGSDDGLLNLSKDGGKNWKNVTPPDMPEWAMINSIEANPFEKGGLYVAATRYKLDDFKPYLFKTNDYGKTWKTITNGINDKHFTRVVRADPKRKGLLYAGTETGMYISFDDGAHWKPFQLNLPVVPVTDLTIKNNDLIVATQGRAFWVIDDLTTLHQLKKDVLKKKAHLFTPRDTYRMGGGRGFGGGSRTAGQNAPSGVPINFLLKEKLEKDEVFSLEILEKGGKSIRKFSSKEKDRQKTISVKAGANQFFWNMRYPNAESFPGMIIWSQGGLTGPRAVPGEYVAKITAGDFSQSVPFTILPDPRVSTTTEDFKAQFDFLIEVRDKLTEMHKAIGKIRDVRTQVNAIVKRTKDHDAAKEIAKAAKSFNDKMRKIEEALYQTKNQSRQDPLNFPNRLNDKLASLAGTASMGDYRPTDATIAVRNEIVKQIDAQLANLKQIWSKDLPAFNALVKSKNVPAVIAK